MATASDNVFPKVILSEGAAPAAPSAGQVKLYAKTDGLLYSKDDAGAETLVSGGAGGGGGGAAFVGARVRHSANQSIPNAAFTAVAFNTEDFDSDGFHDNATNNSRLTVPTGKAGKYLIQAHFEWAGHSSADRIITIKLNNTTDIAYVRFPGSTGSANGFGQLVSTIYDLAVGDYVQVTAYQGSGAGLDIVSSGARSPQFSMTLLGT